MYYCSLFNPKVERYFQIETTREIFEDYAWNFVRGPHLLVGSLYFKRDFISNLNSELANIASSVI